MSKIAWLALALTLAGCAAVGPDYVPPELPVPARWHSLAAHTPDPDRDMRVDWWRALGDPVLTDLIHQAAAENPDAREALSRIREARHQRHRTRAALFPGVDAGGDARFSGRRNDDGTSTDTELYAAGFDAGWEVDVFGGTRRAVEAAQADLEAEIENTRDILVTLLAEVALNYVDVRTYQARLAVAERNVDNLRETWQLLDTLHRTGMGDELAAAQARYNLESARARIPDLEVGVQAAMNRLAVLTGRPPGTLHDRLADPRPLPKISRELAVGVPADVLRQRPDIRRTERELAAQTARIGEATADRYPRFSLSGSIGLEALSLGDLFTAGSRLWSLGPAVSLPLFDAGAIRSNVAVQEERARQALLRYENEVLTALEEVENALVAFAGEQESIIRLQAAAAAARQAADLAEQRYLTGMTGFSDVLDAQRSLLSFEDQMTQRRGAVVAEMVRLYKALGGGWQVFDRSSQLLSETDKG